MPTGLLTDKGMIGSGDLMVKDLSDSEAQWRPIGNARVFTLQPLVEKYERKSYQRATAGQTLETINRTNGVDVRITVDTFGRKNLAIALGGSDTSLTQSEVTAGSTTLTLPHDQWVSVGKYKLSSVGVNDGTEDRTEDTDFLVKEEAGMVMALSTGSITDGASCTVSYNCAAIAADDGGYVIEGGATADVLLSLRLDGYNESTGNSELTEVWRVRVTPEAAISFITSEFNTLDLVGKAETPENYESPFRTTVIPAS